MGCLATRPQSLRAVSPSLLNDYCTIFSSLLKPPALPPHSCLSVDGTASCSTRHCFKSGEKNLQKFPAQTTCQPRDTTYLPSFLFLWRLLLMTQYEWWPKDLKWVLLGTSWRVGLGSAVSWMLTEINWVLVIWNSTSHYENLPSMCPPFLHLSLNSLCPVCSACNSASL